MAEYDYEEGGFMALYFLLTFLIIVLIPLTSSSLIPSFKKDPVDLCKCSECTTKRNATGQRSSIMQKFSPIGILTLSLWAILIAIVYKLATTKIDSRIYDPFEILGLAPTSDEKAIKRHYKRLSVKFHPDKVKLAVNQTIEDVSNYFVDLTKAYKALTDETVRENLRLYGNPDGKQDFKVGIALPPWIIESSNNGWVLGSYALLIGGVLPYFVGRWWFGSRKYTKDGVQGRTAESFFKAMGEDDTITDVVRTFAQGWQFEANTASFPADLDAGLRNKVEQALGSEQWNRVSKGVTGPGLKALTLLYAHLLRVPVEDPKTRSEQEQFLLRSPQLLTSLLAMTLSHNWLVPTLHVMHLHAYLAQALVPGSNELLQLPHVSPSMLSGFHNPSSTDELRKVLQDKGASYAEDLNRASLHLGKLEISDAYFKVLGERIVTPGSIVHLVFQARVIPQAHLGETEVLDSTVPRFRDERHQAFWANKKDTEDLDNAILPLAHAPHWPSDRKPHWWVFVADQKQSRIFVPPMRFTDVPALDVEKSASQPSDRLYKLTFQAPPNAGSLSLQLHFVSDTFVGEDVRKSIVLKVEDVTALTVDEQGAEDDISEPEEDSLAGQMAALRGGAVKRSQIGESDDEDDDSTTDGGATDSDSGSDSDSD